MDITDKEIEEDVQKEIQEFLPGYDNALVKDLSLKPVEISFIYYYVEANFNEGEAYQKAYQYSDKYKAKYYAKKLLKRPDIQDGLNRILGEVWRESVRKLPHQVMESYQRVLNLDVSDYYDDDGMAIPLSSISKEKRSLIGNVQYVMNSKTGAVYIQYDLPDKKDSLAALFSLIKLHKELIGDDGKDENAEASKKRNEIFNSVDDVEMKPVEAIEG
jgi:hypothetical protein